MNTKAYFLIRLDDACPTMNKEKWERIETIFDKYCIKPMVGIIPNNNDAGLVLNIQDMTFWDKARSWQQKGWTIAMHGYDHIYLTNKGGINPVHKRSEFAGLSLKEQEKKIEKGFSILNEHNLDVEYFFAPSHTFDNNTLKALINKTKIRKISDSISRFPYRKGEMIFYPQQFGYFRDIKIAGYWTFCFHPNTIDEKMIYEFEDFIGKHSHKFISFNRINTKIVGRKSLIDRILSTLYFFNRSMRKFEK